MTSLRAAGTLLAADPGNRQLTYRLLPYGEPGATSLGVITAAAGAVQLPAAAADIVLNLEHEPTHPLGRATALAEDDDGLHATFRIAATRGGDDLLTEAAEGLRTGISVELEDVVIRAGALLSARLVGAGATVSPAFPSAQLVASDTPDTPADTPTDTPSDLSDTSSPQVTQAPTAAAGEGDPDTDDTEPDTESDEDTSPDSPSDTDTDPGEAMSVTTSAQAPAPLAATRAAAAPAGLPTRPSARPDPSYSEIVRFLSAEAAAQRHGPGRLYAALADITPAATSVTDITSVPQWLGEVWSGRMYRQRYLPLLTHRPLTNMEIRGWRWKTKPEVDDWAGEKADVPTGPAATEPYTLSAYRIAGAHDIDRIFRDFNVNEFWNGYWSAMTESYARKADTKAKDEIVAGAGANYVTPGAVPDGVATAAAYIVDGALAVIDVATPDFALVSKDLYRELLLTRADDVVAYLTMALGLEEGSIEDFRIVPFNDATTDTVIVGAAGAATVYELPGVPIRVEALDVAKGGIDVGLFGYMTVGTNDSTGMALVSGTAPAAAPVPQSTTTKTTKTTTKS